MQEVERIRRLACVRALYEHFGRTPVQSILADVVEDTAGWDEATVQAAAVRVRQNVTTLAGSSLSAHLRAECRVVVKNSPSGASRLLPKTPEVQRASPEFVRRAVERVQGLARRMDAGA